jgi:acetylornithine deacetylase/succinyl-diaminopimelate desuccinylase-like protein
MSEQRRLPADDVIGLLQSFVRIGSVNPTGDPGTTETGEARMAQTVAACLEDLQAHAEVKEVLPGRPNVLGRFPSDRPDKRKLLLCPHLDTVSVRGMTIAPFAAERRDGKIYGRGACDTKGTMAAMLWALAELGPDVARLEHEIWFAGLMGEEAGNEGAGALAQDFADADFALVGEPTECQIVHTTKGVTWLRLTTRGRAAHSASPHLGKNAIYEMADAVRAVRDELLPAFAAQPDPILGPATASVGTIVGGSKVNIVPEACTVELDLRTIPSQDRKDFVDEVTALLRRACPGLGVEFIRGHRPLRTEPDHPCIRALEAAGGRCVGAPWFCDGTVLADAGIPSVAAGPGSIAQAHTADEWLREDDLHAGVAFYRDFLQRV